jgi:Serine incorporator (Serinc)
MICCAGATCCSCMCLPIKAFGVAAKNFSKVGYVMFQLFWILLAIGTMYAGTWFVKWTSLVGIECPTSSGSGDACFSASGLVRISFCLAIFQFLIFCITLMRNDTAAVIHDGWWSMKFLFVAVLFVISMWIPNEPVLIGYMKFSRILSVAFLSY